jgi:hypothetical protein
MMVGRGRWHQRQHTTIKWYNGWVVDNATRGGGRHNGKKEGADNGRQAGDGKWDNTRQLGRRQHSERRGAEDITQGN